MPTEGDFDQAIHRWAMNNGLTVHTPTKAQGPHHAWLTEGQQTRFIIGLNPPEAGQLKAYAWLVDADGKPGTPEGWVEPNGDLKLILDNAFARVRQWLA